MPTLLPDPDEAPLALARLHRATTVGVQVSLRAAPAGGWTPGLLVEVVSGAGFAPGRGWQFRAERLRTLPDWVGRNMRVLVCGLNPSIYAADAGVGFARPGNRFWPAALAAGLVSRARDPEHALLVDGVGMTDLVKRATATSAELDASEYRDGAARVQRMVARLRPRAVCVVGLEGWRVAVDRRAQPGWQADGFGGVPACLLPSTSGRNARATLEALSAHLADVVERSR